jgi:hypothetical protein
MADLVLRLKAVGWTVASEFMQDNAKAGDTIGKDLVLVRKSDLLTDIEKMEVHVGLHAVRAISDNPKKADKVIRKLMVKLEALTIKEKL